MANRPIMKIKIDGEMLKKRIHEKGYSIRSICKEIGFSPRAVNGYLSRNEMPPYMHAKICVIVGDIEERYANVLKELAQIESDWLKRIPTKEEILRRDELIICAYQFEQMMK